MKEVIVKGKVEYKANVYEEVTIVGLFDIMGQPIIGYCCLQNEFVPERFERVVVGRQRNGWYSVITAEEFLNFFMLQEKKLPAEFGYIDSSCAN
jgi:hypothetical protein